MRPSITSSAHGVWALALVLWSIPSTSSGAGKTLTRPNAAALITAHQRLPRAQIIAIAQRYLKRSWSKPVVGFGRVTVCINEGDKYNDVEKRLTYYQSQGLINLTFERVDGDCPGVWANVALTKAGEKYLVARHDGVYQLKVFDLAFGEVTGVQVIEQLNIATVEYTLAPRAATPFAGNVSRAPISRTATFALYDDGWRLKPEGLVSAHIRWIDAPPTPGLQAAERAAKVAAAAVDPDTAIAMGVLRTAGAEGDTSVPWPLPETQTQASYTEVARKAGIKGTVIVRCSVSEAGDVVATEVVKGLPFGLDAAVVAAVRTWKFRPALKNGKPVAATYDAAVDF